MILERERVTVLRLEDLPVWNLNFTWFVSSDLPARAPESEHLLRCEAHFCLELQCQGGLPLEDRLSMGLLRLECKKLREEIEEIKVCVPTVTE